MCYNPGYPGTSFNNVVNMEQVPREGEFVLHVPWEHDGTGPIAPGKARHYLVRQIVHYPQCLETSGPYVCDVSIMLSLEQVSPEQMESIRELNKAPEHVNIVSS